MQPITDVDSIVEGETITWAQDIREAELTVTTCPSSIQELKALASGRGKKRCPDSALIKYSLPFRCLKALW